MAEPELVLGEKFTDDRGTLIAFNALDMSVIVRSYEILPSSDSIIRAWQGHLREKKWLYCTAGSFLVNLVKLDTFDAPTDTVPCQQFILRAEDPQVLMIPGGYANGFKALEPDSRLQVYSNFTLAESQADDQRYPLEHWNVIWDPKNMKQA